MYKLLTGMFTAQELPPGASEGLPYWIFWLLLCIILLLLTFIFLRDKDMRRRLDNFFAQARNKMIRMRLQKILNKEKTKKKKFITELGRTAWDEKIMADSDHDTVKKLSGIEQTLHQLEEDKQESLSKIQELTSEMKEILRKQDAVIAEREAQIVPLKENLQHQKDKERRLEEKISSRQNELDDLSKNITKARKESLHLEKKSDIDEESRQTLAEKIDADIKNWQENKLQLSRAIHRLTEQKKDAEENIKQKKKEIEKRKEQIKEAEDIKKEAGKKFRGEIKEWEKNAEKMTDQIEKNAAQKEPMLHELGHVVNDRRVENRKLSLYYSKIDRTDRRRGELEKRIEELSRPGDGPGKPPTGSRGRP